MKAGSRRKLGNMELKQLVKMVRSTNAEELTCGECFERMEEFAEYELHGKEPADGIIMVEDHLKKCMDCRQEYEMLLRALKALL
jgi:hypothetical protein